MAYNLTYIAESANPMVWIQRVNTELMFGWFGVLILIVLGTIVFLGFVAKTGDSKKSLATSMFISFALSLLLLIMELVPPMAIYITLFGFAGSVVLIKKG